MNAHARIMGLVGCALMLAASLILNRMDKVLDGTLATIVPWVCLHDFRRLEDLIDHVKVLAGAAFLLAAVGGAAVALFVSSFF